MRYHHLTGWERDVISQMRFSGDSLWTVARELGRDKSTISRDLRRNGPPGDYRPHRAQALAEARRRAAKKPFRLEHAPLRAYVEAKLRAYWSPEQIVGRLKIDFPDDPRMRLSHETIYRHVREDRARGGSLGAGLRQAHRKHRKRYGGRDNRGRIPGRVWIDERPKVVERRGRFGDWEGDTIEGAGKRGYIATHVERRSRFLVAVPLAKKKAAALNRGSARRLRKLPPGLRRTLTVDSGREFARFRALERALGITVYFAHPYCAWERGLSENMNGLLRQFFPKGMDLRRVSRKALDTVEGLLNNRPRKCLGYRTPGEVLGEASAVALQT